MMLPSHFKTKTKSLFLPGLSWWSEEPWWKWTPHPTSSASAGSSTGCAARRGWCEGPPAVGGARIYCRDQFFPASGWPAWPVHVIPNTNIQMTSTKTDETNKHQTKKHHNRLSSNIQLDNQRGPKHRWPLTSTVSSGLVLRSQVWPSEARQRWRLNLFPLTSDGLVISMSAGTTGTTGGRIGINVTGTRSALGVLRR